jgi:uncharacterized damage-inducible protein DinB
MTLTLSVQDLLAYTTWQRHEWHAWFRREGPLALAVTTGPHGDGRMETIGALIRHIFSAELRYVERILARPLTDTASIASDNVEALFQFGAVSRAQLVTLIDTLPTSAWDIPLEFSVVNSTFRGTPRKIVLHVLTHEIRHWAQVGTLLRLQGMKASIQDLLISPVLDGTIPD